MREQSFSFFPLRCLLLLLLVLLVWADKGSAAAAVAVDTEGGYASTARQNLSCLINVKVDMQGKVQEAKVIQSSGNPQFDSSAVSAIMRTSNNGAFPPPPSQAYTDLDLSFSLNDLMGRR